MNFIDSVKGTFDITKGADKISAIEQIRGETILKGSNLFYLICSAILASVGLDTNSPAVIIGAMLISPLMSPILGIGLSLGIHDKENFFISAKEFAAGVVLALFISAVYFSLTPLGNATTEIMGRTKPTALDILIAFFGGTAGIVAITRSKTAAAIPGVAIATALMPPVCTAGYGLASARYEYFLGAIYLFFINAVFISFSSYLVVRYMKFPFKEYLDTRRLARSRIIIYSFVTIAAIPSFIIFYGVISDVRINNRIEKFIKDDIQKRGYNVIEWEYIPGKDDGGNLNIYAVGNPLTKGKKDSLGASLMKLGIGNTRINFTQINDDRGIQSIKGELSSDILAKISLLKKSESEEALDSIRSINGRDSLISRNITEEIRIFVPGIESVGFSRNYYTPDTEDDSLTVKNLPLVTVQWEKKTADARIKSSQNDIFNFIKSRLAADTLKIVNLK